MKYSVFGQGLRALNVEHDLLPASTKPKTGKQRRSLVSVGRPQHKCSQVCAERLVCFIQHCLIVRVSLRHHSPHNQAQVNVLCTLIWVSLAPDKSPLSTYNYCGTTAEEQSFQLLHINILQMMLYIGWEGLRKEKCSGTICSFRTTSRTLNSSLKPLLLAETFGASSHWGFVDSFWSGPWLIRTSWGNTISKLTIDFQRKDGTLSL